MQTLRDRHATDTVALGTASDLGHDTPNPYLGA